MESDPLLYNPKECRICYDSDVQEDLISPCNCKGTRKWVCRECLSKLRRYKDDNICHICRKEFEYEKFTMKQKIKLAFGITKDIIIFLASIVIFYMIIEGLIYMILHHSDKKCDCILGDNIIICSFLMSTTLCILISWIVACIIIIIQFINLREDISFLRIIDRQTMTSFRMCMIIIPVGITPILFCVITGIIILVQRRLYMNIYARGQVKDISIV